MTDKSIKLISVQIAERTKEDILEAVDKAVDSLQEMPDVSEKIVEQTLVHLRQIL